MVSNCKTCFNKFTKKRCTTGKFCSYQCYWESLRVLGKKPICECGEKLSAHGVKKCMKCFNSDRVGEKHPRYIKDRTQVKKSEKKHLDTEYRVWMLGVKNRDNWVCRIADVNCDGRLESHHILNWVDFPELRYDINNGITLCHFHHPRKRADEINLSPFFKELVGNIQ